MINNFKEKLNVWENELYEAIRSKNITILRIDLMGQINLEWEKSF